MSPIPGTEEVFNKWFNEWMIVTSLTGMWPFLLLPVETCISLVSGAREEHVMGMCSARETSFLKSVPL